MANASHDDRAIYPRDKFLLSAIFFFGQNVEYCCMYAGNTYKYIQQHTWQHFSSYRHEIFMLEVLGVLKKIDVGRYCSPSLRMCFAKHNTFSLRTGEFGEVYYHLHVLFFIGLSLYIFQESAS